MTRAMGMIIGVALALLTLASVAYASSGGESAAVKFSPGAFQIDKITCRFAHPEADKALGRNWLEGRIYVAYEDRRHDVLASCTRTRQDRIAACLVHISPTFQASPDRQGYRDTRGVKQALEGLSTCIGAATGVS